ncbi:MAG TPA: alpha/beta hydrolase-fold protein [Isosphaeraceae bacterium]
MRSGIAMSWSLVLVLLGTAAGGPDADPPLTPRTLRDRLQGRPSGGDADRLAEAVRSWFGKSSLAQGPGPKVEELDVAWAIEAPGAKDAPRVVSDDGAFTRKLDRIGMTDVYAGAVTLPEGAAMLWAYEVDGTRRVPGRDRDGRPLEFAPLEVYSTHPDSIETPDVPQGKLTQQPRWESRIFAGTTRDWWVYVPARYQPEEPAGVMVFQDGAGYKDFVPTVFDNLIARKEMPVTVGIFINPGSFAGGRSNRSFEYDTLSDQYARFLLEEILPEVEKTVRLRHDPESRAIAGISSGGICAWTVAWERPDEFRKVLSWVGSFTNIASGRTLREGGHNYEALIRKTPRQPIRAFLQDGARDLDNANGNWPLANQQMAKALAFAGYDHRFVFGQGFHSNKHGRAILPDSLRWLWRSESR